LPVDSAQADYLSDRLLDAQPHEFLVIRDALARHGDIHGDILRDKLWHVVEAPEKGRSSQRLRAAAALASYDPDSPRWRQAQQAVADDLVKVPAVHLAAWMEAFRPVRAQLRAPLAAIFREPQRRDVERSLATEILADYAADQPQVLADLVLDADARQLGVLYPRLRELGEQCLPLLSGEIDRKLPADLPCSDEKREWLAQRQANAAVVLLRMNQPAKVWPLLKRSSLPDDPRVRSYLIHRLGPLGVDAKALLERLDEEPEVSARRALLLSLDPKDFDQQQWTPAQKERLLGRAKELYRTADDPGLHAAAEWLLRQWRQGQWLQETDRAWATDRGWRARRLGGITRLLAAQKGNARPQWYVNGQGQTMVVIPGPVELVMGSPPGEEHRNHLETQHRRRIEWGFAIAAKEVTVEQYRRFDAQFDHNQMHRSPDRDCPILGLTWYAAAAYCNWLSQQEGLPETEWCYVASKDGKHPNEMKLVSDWERRTGYRLPTEVEWECACRAGAMTSRYYGQSDDLLSRYAWYRTNAADRTWPGGRLKPNDYGLFDMYGNVIEWCHDRYTNYPTDPGGMAASNVPEDVRVVRGGAYDTHPFSIRSAYRLWSGPWNADINFGFRPARTLR
jgi:formylglycine-generating enzyme required for sulfatase activity